MKRTKNWIVETSVIDWRSIRKLVDNRYISGVFIWLVILPVSAKFASKIPDSITLPNSIFGENVVLELTLPFTWYILYIAAVFFSFSRLIYLGFCPSFVQAYDNAGDAISKGVTVQMYHLDLGDEIIKHLGSRGKLSDYEKGLIDRLLKQLDLYAAKDFNWLMLEVTKQKFGELFRKSLAKVRLGENPNKLGYYLFTTRSHDASIHRDQLQKHLWWDMDRILKGTHLYARIISTFCAYIGYLLLLCVFLQSAIWVYYSL